jgi:hypothetical protein
MLVVSNAYLESVLRPLVPESLFFPYLQRTIDLLHNLSPVSLIFKKHCDVLVNAQKSVEIAYREKHGQPPPRYLSKVLLQAAVSAAVNGVGNMSTSASSVTGSGRGRAVSGSGSHVGSQRDPSSHPSTPTFHPTSAHGGNANSSFGGRPTN